MKSIDKIARETNKDVLFLEFITITPDQTFEDFLEFKHRKDTITWLYDMGIVFEECYPMSETGEWKAGYLGHLYFPSVTMDTDDGVYRVLQEHFEKPNGSPRIPGVIFFYLPLKDAQVNAHFDPIPNKMKRRNTRFVKS
jgi:hypothetical protein